jgi:hypothetical protein
VKQIIAILTDDSEMKYKEPVPDDFDVEAWAEKRKHLFAMLGIKSIRVEMLPSTGPKPRQYPHPARRDTKHHST